MADEHDETEKTTAAEESPGVEDSAAKDTAGADETAAAEESTAEATAAAEESTGEATAVAEEPEAGESPAAAEAADEPAVEEEPAAAAEPAAEEEPAVAAESTEEPAAAEEAAASAEADEPAAGEGEAPAGAAAAGEHTYEELKGMTVVRMREVAEAVGEHDALHGYTTMHKEELLVALCAALGIEAHEHHEVVGIDKSEVKSKIRALKQQREALIEAKDARQLKIVRRRIRSLKRKIHKATV